MLYLIGSSFTLGAMEQELKSNSNAITSAITFYKLEDKTITETLNEDYDIPYKYNTPQHAGGFSLPINFQGDVSINNIKKSLICVCYCSLKDKKRFLSFIHADNRESFSELLFYFCEQKIHPQNNDLLTFCARTFPLSATTEMVKACQSLMVKKPDIKDLTIKPDNIQLCTLNLIVNPLTFVQYKITTKNKKSKSEVHSSIFNNDTGTATQNSNSQCITS
jgi:hypothetical protein